jgi:plastocyanin
MIVRRWRLIAQVVLVGTLAVLALPSSSSALAAVSVSLTSTGPSPGTLTIGAGRYPIWINQDTVDHTVTFANGCSMQVASGGMGQCSNGPWDVVGDYAYTVDGTTQADVKVTPEWRAVTLKANSHAIRPGSKLLLHGNLAVSGVVGPQHYGPRMPVTVFAVHLGRLHPLQRIAVVTAKPLKTPHYPSHSVWQLWVRPQADTIYFVVANSQPKAGQYWQRAVSKLFAVKVRG